MRRRLGGGSGLGLGLAADGARGVAAGLPGCLVLGLEGGLALRCGVAASLGFGWAVGAGFAGVRCRLALLVPGCGAAAALEMAQAPVAGTGSGVCVDGVARGSGVGVLDNGVVVEVDEVVVVVEDVE